MQYGYMEKFLFVDLTSSKIEEYKLGDVAMREYLGGYGIGAKILYERQKGGIDPLGEENHFGILAGPLTGVTLPFVSRYTVVGKSPLTDVWGDANGSGFFGPAMKFSGYDGIFFTGISDKPVYLLINRGKAQIFDASDLWGKDTYATEDFIKSRYGNKAEVACIGQSGERLSRIAGVVTAKGRTAARSGLGAVMGSKKLKAIVVIGNRNIQVAAPDLIETLRKKFTKQMRDGLGFAEFYSVTGTPGYVESGVICGDSPIKNWFGNSEKDLKNIENYQFDNIKKYITKKNSCYKCPMGCWGHVMIEKGPYKLKEEVHIPEYESTSAFGSYCLKTKYESIIKCNDICNRFGIDTISAGSIIAFAISCYEEGLITRKDTDGIELTWGNHRSIVKMTEKLAKREGFGDFLADGVMRAAMRIGKKAEKFAIHVGGQELPAHDPRFEPSLASIYKNNASPGRHTQDAQYVVPPKLPEIYPDVDFSFSFGNRRDLYAGRAKAQKTLSSLNHCVNALGMCLFGFLSTEVTFMSECYSAVTGWDVDLDELIVTGERIGDMRLAFTLREGVNPIKLSFPDIAIGKPPLKEGQTKGISVDLDLLTKEFCKEMDWDEETGKPSERRLKELSLSWLIQDLWGSK